MSYDKKILSYIAKNHLTYYNSDNLIEKYEDEDSYYNFLNMIILKKVFFLIMNYAL